MENYLSFQEKFRIVLYYWSLSIVKFFNWLLSLLRKVWDKGKSYKNQKIKKKEMSSELTLTWYNHVSNLSSKNISQKDFQNCGII
jgi:hypothetical protein